MTYTNSGLLITFLQLPFQFAERGQLAALEFFDPPLADLMDRHRIEIVQLLAAIPERGHEVGCLENHKMLCHGLPCHGEAVAEFLQGLTVLGVKPVQQRPPRSIGQRFEDLIHGSDNRQPKGCMSRGVLWISSSWPGFVPAIHVFLAQVKLRRGCPASQTSLRSLRRTDCYGRA